MGELKKIEMRKKEREKKTQDLQKLITAADTNMESRRAERKATKKKLQEQRHKQRGSDIGVCIFVSVEESDQIVSPILGTGYPSTFFIIA